MWGLQGFEWIILLVFVILILFGAKKLPELARSIGKATGEFQRGRREIEKQLKELSEETPAVEESDIIRAAKSLGIDTEGKTEEEIREEMKKKLSEKQ